MYTEEKQRVMPTLVDRPTQLISICIPDIRPHSSTYMIFLSFGCVYKDTINLAYTLFCAQANKPLDQHERGRSLAAEVEGVTKQPLY